MITTFENILHKIDAKIPSTQSSEIPRLFSEVPLDVFGKLLLDVPEKFSNIKAFFPSMASEEVQDRWTGSHGDVLLYQSLSFVRTLVRGYEVITGENLENANVLDYGCGWGRLTRLLYKFVQFEKIYAVDPWDESIKECKRQGIMANLALSEWVPRRLPFSCRFDLIFAFSVFTHLSEKTAHVVLRTLREYITDKGILAITIRPKEYWHIHEGGKLSSEMIGAHEEEGFAFVPLNLPPIEGDITYGDTSISLDYISRHFPQWKIVSTDYNLIDPYQVVLFLKPV